MNTINDFLNSEYWQTYKESIDSNIPVNDPERYDRIYEASADGADGSTHAEVIQDWREAIQDARRDKVITAKQEKHLLAECNRCEKWHSKNRSLHKQIG